MNHQFPITQLARDIEVAAPRLNQGNVAGGYAVQSAYHSSPMGDRQAHKITLVPTAPDSTVHHLMISSGYSEMDDPIQTVTVEHNMQPMAPTERTSWLGRLAIKVLNLHTIVTETVTYEQSRIQDHPYTTYKQTEEGFLFGRFYVGSGTIMNVRNGQVLYRENEISGLSREVAGLLPTTTTDQL